MRSPNTTKDTPEEAAIREDIRLIREEMTAKGVTVKAIAAEYNLAVSTVNEWFRLPKLFTKKKKLIEDAIVVIADGKSAAAPETVPETVPEKQEPKEDNKKITIEAKQIVSKTKPQAKKPKKPAKQSTKATTEAPAKTETKAPAKSKPTKKAPQAKAPQAAPAAPAPTQRDLAIGKLSRLAEVAGVISDRMRYTVNDAYDFGLITDAEFETLQGTTDNLAKTCQQVSVKLDALREGESA